MTTVLEPGSELDPSGCKTHNLCTGHILFNRLWCPHMYRKDESYCPSRFGSVVKTLACRLKGHGANLVCSKKQKQISETFSSTSNSKKRNSTQQLVKTGIFDIALPALQMLQSIERAWFAPALIMLPIDHSQKTAIKGGDRSMLTVVGAMK